MTKLNSILFSLKAVYVVYFGTIAPSGKVILISTHNFCHGDLTKVILALSPNACLSLRHLQKGCLKSLV